MGPPKIKYKLLFRKNLFNRLGALVLIFTFALISLLWYQFNYAHITQDSILDAHENYYYSQMVTRWGTPPDTNLVIIEIENLQILCGIFEREINSSGIALPGNQYWSNLPNTINKNEFYSWTMSSDYESMYDIDIPLEVFYGEINHMPTTVVDDGKYLYYLVIDYIEPNEIYNFFMASFITVLFMFILYLFISSYLQPVQLMKKRIQDLEDGDLESKIEIIGEDELADLSSSINQLIKDINILLENKHQLLLEVSHELRSPLSRMQLLIDMIPKHKNLKKLRSEVIFLEGLIENLLLSDRLSMPYSKLDIINLTTHEIINKVLDMFPNRKSRINIINTIPNEIIKVDKTKFSLALRNLCDNAFKYSNINSKINLSVKKNNFFEFTVSDFGIGIQKDIIENITKPFYQANQTVSTKGFGLGLTICKKIIESHNGHLTIASEFGKGSVFSLHLPC